VKFVIIFLASFCTVKSCVAQCVRFTHPPGVTRVMGTTPGCDEIAHEGQSFWFSLLRAPRVGQTLDFTFLDTPSYEGWSQGLGYVTISNAFRLPGVRVPRTAGPLCVWHVFADTWCEFPIPLRPGCHVRSLYEVPNDPRLIGLMFFAQAYAVVPEAQIRIAVGNTIAVVVQP
jgi:hypothetical protein